MAAELATGPLVLVALRLFAILRMQPLWSAALGVAWIPVAAGLSIVLGLVLVGDPRFVGPPLDATLTTWIVLGVLEVLLGSVIGALVSLPGHALLGAAGTSAALLRTSPRPFVALTVAIALTAALASGLHHPLFEVLTDGLRVMPPGRPEVWLPDAQRELPAMLFVALDGLLVLGLCFAAPVLLTVATVRFGLGAIGLGPSSARAVVDGVDAWVAVALALVALGASWAVYPHAWARAAALP